MRYRCDAIWKQKKEERECYVKSERISNRSEIRETFSRRNNFYIVIEIDIRECKLNYFCGGNTNCEHKLII